MTISIKKRMQRLQAKKQKIHEEIVAVQTAYPHADLKSTWGSDTGNWDPSADSYWKDYHCQDCDKRWRVYSE